MRRLAIVLLLASRAHAAPAITIHTSCTAPLARDPALCDEHLRTLRHALAESLADLAPGVRYTLEVTLENLSETTQGAEVEVLAEVRALVVDARGAMRWSSTSRVMVRGAPRARAQLRRDAVIEATRALAATIRTRL